MASVKCNVMELKDYRVSSAVSMVNLFRLWMVARGSNTDLGSILFSNFLDSGLLGFSSNDFACGPSIVLLCFQIQAIFDSTILPLYKPGVGLDATTDSGGLENSLTTFLPFPPCSVGET